MHRIYPRLFKIAIVANESIAQEYDLKFLCSGINEPLFVDADPDRMMQIMENLLSNATKFSPSDGHVSVSLERHEGKLRIAVKDHGSGIEEG
ncbi:MAG: signal transduction histidine kinase [Arenicella sp.]|jgi:signal transduction histidine kinase